MRFYDLLVWVLDFFLILKFLPLWNKGINALEKMGGYKSSVILCLRYQIPLYVYMQSFLNMYLDKWLLEILAESQGECVFSGFTNKWHDNKPQNVKQCYCCWLRGKPKTPPLPHTLVYSTPIICPQQLACDFASFSDEYMLQWSGEEVKFKTNKNTLN